MPSYPSLQSSADLPPPPYSSNRLGERIERVLTRMFIRAITALRAVLVEVFSAGLELFFDVLKPVLRTAYGPLLSKLRDQPGCPPEIKAILNTALTSEGEAGAALLSMAGQAAGGAVMGSAMSILTSSFTRWLNESFRPQRPDLATLQALLRRKQISQGQYDTAVGEIGWETGTADAIKTLTQPRLDIGAMAQNAWRTGQSLETLRDELQRRGYSEADIGAMFRVLEQIPNPPDLVRMAVREAFSPDAIARFQLHADFPAAFGEWMEKQGFSAEWARAFWAAHWELPSATMGMEMLHRGEIEPADFALLLRMLDVAPYWRSKIEAISYTPLTLVDARRMYQAEVIDRERIIKVYKARGYTEQDASAMADWVQREYAPEDKALAKSDVLDGFRRGLLTQAEARNALVSLEYPGWAVDFYIEREQAKLADEIEQRKTAVIQKRYTKHLISATQARQQLAALELPSGEIDTFMDLWTASIAEQTEKPGVSKLEEFYTNAVITADDLAAELRAENYTDRYIQWYLRNLDAEARKRADAEAERARKEQERLETARQKTRYEQDLARINVDLALQRQRIVAAQSALNATLTDVQILALQDQVEQIDAEIASIRTAIAQRQQEVADARAQLQNLISDQEREHLEQILAAARIAIADTTQRQDELKVEQAQIDELLLTVTDDEEELLLKQRKAALDTEIAELAVQIDAQRLAEAQARSDLRLRIPDEQRERLENTIQDGQAAVAAYNLEIAEQQQRRAETELEVTQAISPEDRAILLETIRNAQQQIAELSVEKAGLRLED